jgi:hypothetical protein
MSSSIAARSCVQRSLVVLGASIALLAGLSVSAASAEARPDAGEPVASRVCGPFDDPRTFPVERLGNHLVRCDYLVR